MLPFVLHDNYIALWSLNLFANRLLALVTTTTTTSSSQGGECLFDKTVTFINPKRRRRSLFKNILVCCWCRRLIAKGNLCDKYSFIRICVSKCFWPHIIIVAPRRLLGYVKCDRLKINKWIEKRQGLLYLHHHHHHHLHYDQDCKWISQCFVSYSFPLSILIRNLFCCVHFSSL